MILFKFILSIFSLSMFILCSACINNTDDSGSMENPTTQPTNNSGSLTSSTTKQDEEFLLLVLPVARARSVVTDRDYMIFFRSRLNSLPDWEYFSYPGNVILETSISGQWVEIVDFDVDINFAWGGSPGHGGSHGLISFDNPLAAGDYRLRHYLTIEGVEDIEDEVEFYVEFIVIPFDNAAEPAWNIREMNQWHDEWHRPQISDNISIIINNPALSMSHPNLEITITANSEYTYGEFFLVYIVDNDWGQVPTMMGYEYDTTKHSIFPNIENIHKIDLINRYGILPPGQYRLNYEMHLPEIFPGVSDWELGSVEFTVNETLDWLR